MTESWEPRATAYLNAPLITLSVLIGDANAAFDHAAATDQLDELVPIGDVLTTATAAWEVRRRRSGGLPNRPHHLDEIIADARGYATTHPVELAAHDQQFAAFMDRVRGER